MRFQKTKNQIKIALENSQLTVCDILILIHECQK